MMIITLSPIRGDAPITSLEVYGETLWIDGMEYPLGPFGDGPFPDAHLFARPVWRDDEGVLNVSLIFQHGANAPRDALFPAPIVVTEDGPVSLPAYEIEQAPVVIDEEEPTFDFMGTSV